jgi:hypothetical protein
MPNLNQPLPVTPSSPHSGPSVVTNTPLANALAQGAQTLFRSPTVNTAIPAGGTYELDIPFRF